MKPALFSVLLLHLAEAAFGLPTQETFSVPVQDLHPDPHYRNNGTIASACHRKKPKSDPERGGVYGAPRSDCDSSLALIDHVMNWLEKEWVDEIDFVLWTGDSARHDNDRIVPRTPSEIYELNRLLVSKMEKIFGKRGIPVVPSLGNNDIWRPNAITQEFSSIWRPYIPFPSYQVFARGGYFSKEIIPGRLAAISLNTMYFYDSNKAVGGCEWVNRDQGGNQADPGNLELDWLEVQLDDFRSRGIKVWISGHVPPSPGNYFPECLWRYTAIVLRYQDTVVGQVFGHMNVDFFFYLDAHDLRAPVTEGESTVGMLKKDKDKKLHRDLVSDFAELPKLRKLDMDDFSIVNVAPAIVPNPYMPGIRVWGYNVTGWENQTAVTLKNPDREHRHRHPDKERCKRAEDKKKWWCKMPKREWYSDADAPSRKNGLWSPLGYAQFWLPDLRVDGTGPPEWELEYATYQNVHDPRAQDGWRPIPARMVSELKNKDMNKVLPYGMEDGTIGSWMKLARRIGQKKRTLREDFRRLMYME
ncbi:hypothetical protein SISNIDRAFT_472565 [Sistotremastrum niveocremeum HHB9708]|uniref:Uncharacterized protein n=1 Tax=Sistotremastrum niveocremeum HHB9708 TaxID=1314777 RepID=A0A164Z679_9AGAM|nr:hypothetical protein SISNIDRAFT_472565 [Sistotremastrum niveocremeum HHB9708]